MTNAKPSEIALMLASGMRVEKIPWSIYQRRARIQAALEILHGGKVQPKETVRGKVA